jgi:hypothetical protein
MPPPRRRGESFRSAGKKVPCLSILTPIAGHEVEKTRWVLLADLLEVLLQKRHESCLVGKEGVS